MDVIRTLLILISFNFFINRSDGDLHCISLPQLTSPQCSVERQKDLQLQRSIYSLLKPPQSVDFQDYQNDLQKACLFPLMNLTWLQVVELTKKDPEEANWLKVYTYQLATSLHFLNNQQFRQFKTTEDFIRSYHTVRDLLSQDDRYKQYFRYPSLVEQEFQNITKCERWKEEKVFVEQRLAGLNPMSLQKLTNHNHGPKVGVRFSEIEEKLNWQFDWDSAVSTVIGRRTTLKQAILRGDVFISHFPYLKGLTNVADIMHQGNKNRKIKKQTSPIALFVSKYYRKWPGWRRELKVVAIQTDSNKDSPVYTPDDGNKWLLAKLEYQLADFLHVELIEHLLKTHLVMQPICLIAKRTLSKYHPFSPILKQHCRGLMASNSNGFPKLVLPGGYMHMLFSVGNIGALELLNKAYKDLDWKQLGFQDDLKRRGVDNWRKIHYFPYRDDGKLIWNEIKQFVRDYTSQYYWQNSMVSNDDELKNFANEVSRSGTGVNGGIGQLKGFPNSITTINQVVDVFSRILWLPIQHNAVNYPIAYYGAFVPNMPTRLYDDPRATPEEYSFFNLPDSHVATIQSVVSMSLGSLRYDTLLDYSSKIEDLKARWVVEYHHEALRQITDDLEVKNKERYRDGHLTYPYFTPKWIPNSIHT